MRGPPSKLSRLCCSRSVFGQSRLDGRKLQEELRIQTMRQTGCQARRLVDPGGMLMFRGRSCYILGNVSVVLWPNTMNSTNWYSMLSFRKSFTIWLTFGILMFFFLYIQFLPQSRNLKAVLIYWYLICCVGNKSVASLWAFNSVCRHVVAVVIFMGSQRWSGHSC